MDVVAVQASAIVDLHVALPNDQDAIDLLRRAAIEGDVALGGSRPVSREDMDRLLREAGPYTCHPGGSASNVLRAAARFGATTRLVGARGDDANGELYAKSLRDAGICTEHLIVKGRDASGTELSTAACCVISHNNQRSMRTMFADTAHLEISELRQELFKSCKYLFASSYACYFEGMLARLVEIGSTVGCKILLDLGSFEIVNAFSDQMDGIFGKVDICVCNEDEAAAFSRLHTDHTNLLDRDRAYDAAARWMLGHGVKAAVLVTLGERGCILYERLGDGDAFRKTLHPATHPEGSVVDSTGAGDAFCGGLLFALSQGRELGDAVRVANAAGAAAVKSMGAVLDDDALRWFRRKVDLTA